MTAAKRRNFKVCCESGGTEKRRHALGTPSVLPPRHGTLLILPSAAPSNPFGPCRYGAEEPDAFWPRTHASMFFQSGSSWDANCLPPWWVSAMPPASGTSGINRNRLEHARGSSEGKFVDQLLERFAREFGFEIRIRQAIKTLKQHGLWPW